MGILRMDLPPPPTRSAVWNFSDAPVISAAAAIADVPGTAAASKLPPVAARNRLRSRPASLRPLFICFFLRDGRTISNQKTGPRHYTLVLLARRIPPQVTNYKSRTKLSGEERGHAARGSSEAQPARVRAVASGCESSPRSSQ